METAGGRQVQFLTLSSSENGREEFNKLVQATQAEEYLGAVKQWCLLDQRNIGDIDVYV